MNRKYLIIGGSSDIGMKYIRHLNGQAQPGTSCQIMAHYRRMNDTFAGIQEECGNLSIETVQADLSNMDEVEALIRTVSDRYGAPTHILHLAASQFGYKRITEFDRERFLMEMNIQVVALAEILKVFLPSMAESRFGRVIVMLSSCTLGAPPKYLSEYNMVKYTLLGLVKSMAMEYGADGITVNAVSPAMVETKFLKKIGRKIKEMAAESSPAGRNLMPEDLMGMFDYLGDESSQFVNGVNMNMSGGTLL